MKRVEYVTLDSDEHWHSLRAKDVTSTESAALFGLSPYMTEMELFYRKLTGEAAEFTDNARMKAGRILEPAIAKLAGEELNCRVLPFKRYGTNDDRMGSSFDFRITTGPLKGYILEIKNVDYLVYRDNWLDDEAPDHIEVQVQHQLELTGRPGAVIAALVGGNDLKLIVRERNEKMGAAIRKRIQRFWADVESNTPPEPDYLRDADFIIGLNYYAGDKIFDASEDEYLLTAFNDYKRMKAEAKDLDNLTKAIKAEVLDRVGPDYNKIVSERYSVAISNVGGKDEEFVFVTPDMLGQKVEMEISEKMVGKIVPVEVTEEMVDQEWIISDARRGYRMFRVTEKKIKQEKQA